MYQENIMTWGRDKRKHGLTFLLKLLFNDRYDNDVM